MVSIWHRLTFQIGLSISILLVTDHAAKATEIVLIGCPDGLVVVSDKRESFTVARNGRFFDDQASKVAVCHPFLIAQTGRLFELYQSDMQDPAKKTREKFFGHNFRKEASAAAKYKSQSITEPMVSRTLAAAICQAYELQATLASAPWKIKQDDYISSVAIMKKSSGGAMTIEVIRVFLGARETPNRPREIFANDIESFSYTKNDVFARLLGLGHSTMNASTELKSPPQSLANAVSWAEHEVLNKASHNQHIGPIVDEYLVDFDGNVRRLASSKRLNVN